MCRLQSDGNDLSKTSCGNNNKMPKKGLLEVEVKIKQKINSVNELAG